MTDTPRYGHKPLLMRRVAEEGAIAAVGDFAWKSEGGVRYLVLAIPRQLPYESDSWMLVVLPVRIGPSEQGKFWRWNGSEAEPTLTPSVHSEGHWHGWVRDGMLVEA